MDANSTPTTGEYAKKTIKGAGNLLTFLIVLIVDVALGFFAFKLFSLGYLPLGVCFVLIIIMISVAFLVPKAYMFKWMAVGLSAWLLFSIFPIVYTIYNAFTNYGDGHLITQAQVLLAIDSTKYGDFDVDAANTGLWRVGARVDGDDSSAGISSGISFEGMVTLPLTTGDANLDGVVDVTDLGILATNYGGDTDITWGLADFNCDGVVDVTDLGILATNYGSGTPHGTPTPEPTTLGLLGIGVLGIIRRRRN
mgnify:CR=1 FL=1